MPDLNLADPVFFGNAAQGVAFAAQFVDQMRREINVDELLRTSRYGEIQKWLREKFQHYGCFYDAPDIMKMVTGKEFDPQYYIEYLENKYRGLYLSDKNNYIQEKKNV